MSDDKKPSVLDALAALTGGARRMTEESLGLLHGFRSELVARPPSQIEAFQQLIVTRQQFPYLKPYFYEWIEPSLQKVIQGPKMDLRISNTDIRTLIDAKSFIRGIEQVFAEKLDHFLSSPNGAPTSGVVNIYLTRRVGPVDADRAFTGIASFKYELYSYFEEFRHF
jgi:hypothetical protein